MISAHRFRLLLFVAWAAALGVAIAFVVRGDWAQFGGFLAGLPAGWKSGGFRRAYLQRWILPASAAYVLLLCGSIFLGVRRLRKGAR